MIVSGSTGSGSGGAGRGCAGSALGRWSGVIVASAVVGDDGGEFPLQLLKAGDFELVAGKTSAFDVGLIVLVALEDFVVVLRDDFEQWLAIDVDGRHVVVVNAPHLFVGWLSIGFVDDSAIFIGFIAIEFKKRAAVRVKKVFTGYGVNTVKLLGKISFGRKFGGRLLFVPGGVFGSLGHEDLLVMDKQRLLHDAS